MKNEIISLETAKLVKEKITDLYDYDEIYILITEDHYAYDGHKGDEFLMYSKGEIKCFNTNHYDYFLKNVKFEVLGKAPSQHILQRYLREKHFIHINILVSLDDYYLTSFTHLKEDVCELHGITLKNSSYEEALEAGLLEIMKQL